MKTSIIEADFSHISNRRIFDMITNFASASPQIGRDCFIAPTAFVAGQVTLGDRVTIWPGASLRGDINTIAIGNGTNIQDNASIHVGHADEHSVQIGENVTIGHNAVVHGARVGDNALIGMGAIVLDGAVIGEGAIVAAGALVSPGSFIAPGMLAMGSPAREKRPVTDHERESVAAGCLSYQNLAAVYNESCCNSL